MVAFLGIFLLVEQFSIRETLLLVFQNFILYLGGSAQRATESARNMITRFSLSDLLGWVLVLLALTFIAWRSRYHFIHSEYWKAVNCPKCGSALHRIHRTSWDRFLSRTLLPGARRYRCKNPECGWSGLRERREEDHHHKRHGTDEAG